MMDDLRSPEIVALVALGASGIAIVLGLTAVFQSRLGDLQGHFDDIVRRIQDFDKRLAQLEERLRESPSEGAVTMQEQMSVPPKRYGNEFASPDETVFTPAQGVSPYPPAGVPERTTAASLTRDAASALSSLDDFRRFAEAAGGEGLRLIDDKQRLEPVDSPDQVLHADIWAIPHEDHWLLFPGYNLRRGQSALLADAGRVAQERLGWLYEVQPGEQLRAIKPAINDGSCYARGILTIPL